ncbi:MAG: radical SAM/SPASM domain-containing protein [Candidatus Micrarchaeia archaeon]
MLQAIERGTKLALAALESNFVQLKFPYKLNFAITYRCQSRCVTCNIWKLRPTNELSINEIREFASKNPFFKWVGLTGGEPFLREDIVEIVEAFNKFSKPYLVTLPTNALCDHDMILKKLGKMSELSIPMIVVTVSLDGYRELHDKIRGVPGNYDKAIDLFSRVRELGKEKKNVKAVIGYTISKFNQGQLEKSFELIKKDLPFVTYGDFHINVAQQSSGYYHNSIDIMPDRDKAIDDIKVAIKGRGLPKSAMDLIENRFLKGLLYFVKSGKSPLRSKSLDASLFLDSTGNVYPSIMWDFKIGNIRDANYSLKELWEKREIKEIRKLTKEKKDPQAWTSCEAYQSILGDIKNIL